ncbi:hypothetical protein [Halorubrum sp. BV1]|uniref:hypothetical protein n=1 Tax=Halorubrum sp. BV1 TaxID=1498500 RepID=UPI0006787B11|nr:hypothetical protein [Halorubrum sp. BV1]
MIDDDETPDADDASDDEIEFDEPDRDGPGPALGSGGATDAFDDEAIGSPDDEATDPFDELGPASEDAGDTGDRRDLDDAFEQMEVGDLDDEDVWESLDEDGDAIGAPTSEVDPVAAAPSRGDAPDAGHADRTVDKRTYCQQCPHFTAPPEAACTHEGTEIVEVVDVDEFRVRNCPVVSKADRAAESARDT